MSIEDDFAALKRVHDSVNERVQYLEKENNELKLKLGVLQAEKAQWAAEKSVQLNIIAQQLAASDSKRRDLEFEIIQLKKELKELRGE